jgi:hypothetical protein
MVTVPADAPAWARQLADDITRDLRGGGTGGGRGGGARGFPVAMASFSKANLPDPARWADCWIVVSDATGGRVPAYSDGTAWLRPNSTVID